ncbi:hypothetical protein KUTeg_014870 [Tegillarca granosa]|uniref:Uncharacterized protein n=1 Tax=Tegillarca granosa TaxID=220873 RepID=A0ABQ9EW04_TEGGR|nr:hypothetical protein KUTeg_014870 [Tegillarca granosa]
MLETVNSLLNRARVGELTAQNISVLSSRVQQVPESELEQTLHIFPKLKQKMLTIDKIKDMPEDAATVDTPTLKALVLDKCFAEAVYVGVTAKTEVAMCQPISVPDSIKEQAPHFPGKQVSPSSTKRLANEKELRFQEIRLKDQSAKVNCAIW